MEIISPLAKELAEMNGIDWRRIHGSGQSGQVVEQDVLLYLSRIMSGEEDPPDTPVDLPPPDWAGDAPSVAALSAAGVDSDIADFVASARSETPEPEIAMSAELGSDAMDFELELDDEEHDDPAVTRDPDEMAQQPRDADYAGADVQPPQPNIARPGVPGPRDVVYPERPVAEPVAPPETGYVDPAQASPPHVPATDLGLPQDAPTRQQDIDDGVPSTPRTGESGWHDRDDEPKGQAADAAAAASITGGLLSSLYQSTPTPPESAAQSLQAEAEADFGLELEEENEAPAELQAGGAQAEPVQPEPVQPESVQVEPVQVEAVQVEPVEPVEVEVAPVAAQAEAVPAEVEAAAPVVAAPVEAAAVAQAPVVAAAATSVRHATLRLSFDAAPLAAAGLELSEHFAGRQAPLSVFVARAAARQLSDLGLAGVGVYGVSDEVNALATPSLTVDFRAAVGEVLAARPGETSALMVIDAGELGLDELQLPGEGVTLTLGRVRDGQATLTLTGNVSARAGAAFLQAVAQLLAAPIRLML